MPSIMKSMNAISRAQGLYRAAHSPSDELAPCHWAPLFTVLRAPGLTQEEIARELSLNKSTVARSLSYLSEHGFIERRVDGRDKRALYIYPTEKLAALREELCRVAAEWNALICEGVSRQELAVFLRVLDRMEKKAKETVRAEEACEK